MERTARLPSIVIVGRPNVGKSTLFNRILGARRAIVGDEPGITRDRIRGEASYAGKRFELVDTGGILPHEDDLIPAEILKQARVALEAADQVILLVDGRAELTAADRELAGLLRRLGKPVTVAVNKIDVPKRELLAHEFYELGFDAVFPISAEHQLGLDELLEHLTRDFQAAPAEQTRPPARITEARLLSLMENAGKDLEDEDLAAAMHERGLGTPATRAGIAAMSSEEG